MHTFPGVDIGAFSSRITTWWPPSALRSKPFASIPRCKCMNDSLHGIPSASLRSFALTASAGMRCSYVSHTDALDSTMGARISSPLFSFTPTALFPSFRSSNTLSTCVFNLTSPPCFSSPLTSAFVISSAPPTGNSGSFHTSDCRGGVQRRQVEFKDIEGGY
eukprot:31546-Pelagococcus_subviridis.AAC.7